MELQTVPDFYSGKSVFLTGGTGFLGKVFIEKLLRSCPDIDKIYILARAKKNLTAIQRVEQLTANELFAKLKETRPQDLKKIIPIIGNIDKPNLDISQEDEQTLIEKVAVVFHIAAIIKFNEPLKVALNSNVEGTRRVLDLCHRMKNIKALIHVSTAYTNTEKKFIDEKVYPPPITLKEAYELAEIYNDVEVDETMLYGKPNTYTFTKMFAEDLILKEHGNVPAAIIRPSVVIPAIKEPIKGWVDNWYGITGILFFMARGLNRFLWGFNKNIIDLIPVDYVSNLAIVAASRCNSSDTVSVYNSCSSQCNPITTSRLVRQFTEECKKRGLTGMPYPRMFFVNYKWLLVILTILFQIIPAYLLDFWLLIINQKTKYVKLQNQVMKVRNSISYFSYHEYVLKANRVGELAATLSEAEREEFPFDPATIDWDKTIEIYSEGVLHHLIKHNVK